MSTEIVFPLHVDVALRDHADGPQVVSCAALSTDGHALPPGVLLLAVNGESLTALRPGVARARVREAALPVTLQYAWPRDLEGASPLSARAQARQRDLAARKLSFSNDADDEPDHDRDLQLPGGDSGPLGLSLETDFLGTHVCVRAATGLAAAAGARPGQLVLAVNGRSLEGMPFRRAMDLLRRETEAGNSLTLRVRDDSAHYRGLQARGDVARREAVESLRAQHLALSQALSVERFYHHKCLAVLFALLPRVGPVALGDLQYAAVPQQRRRSRSRDGWGALAAAMEGVGDEWLVELRLPADALPRVRLQRDAMGRLVLRAPADFRQASGAAALPPLCDSAELLSVSGVSAAGMGVHDALALLARARGALESIALTLRVPGASPEDDAAADEGVEFDVEFHTDDIGLALETGYGGHGVLVRDVDAAGEAAVHPHILPGLEVLAVDGAPAVEMPFAHVVAAIRDGPRPVTVTFKDAERSLDVADGGFDALFDTAEPLGLRLETDFYGQHAVVARCEPGSQAARVHPPLAGFVLTAANGRSLEGRAFADAMRVLQEERDQPPPLVLRFLDEHAHYSGLAGGAGAAAAAAEPVVEQQIAAWLSAKLHDVRDAHAQARRLTAAALDSARAQLCPDVTESDDFS